MDISNFSNLNWLHILVAAIAYFGLGSVWYSALFGKKWVVYQRIDMTDPNVTKGVYPIMFVSFLWMIVITTGLALLINRLHFTQAISGVKLGLLTGICFSAASISISYLYVKKPLGLHVIDNLYHIAGQIIAAIILCIWR